MREMKATPFSAKEFVKDGVELFVVFDFDGVFNPFTWDRKYGKLYFTPDCHLPEYPNPDWEASSRYGSGSKEPKSYRVQWSSELILNLNKLLSDKRIQIIILSTWRQHMAGLVDRLHIRSKRTIYYLPWGGSGEHRDDQFYKAIALRNFMDGVNESSNGSITNAGLLWVDDHVLSDARLGYRDGMPSPEFDENNSLLIAPNEWYGINRMEWDRILEFSAKILDKAQLLDPN
jgi:hypothetical protein